MTHTPNIARNAHRRAAALLLAAVALPTTAWAQEAVTPPQVLVPSQPAPAPAPAPAPPPTVSAPATPPQSGPPQSGPSRTPVAPGVAEQAAQEAREKAAAARAARAEARPQPRAARPAPPAPVAERAAAPVATAEPVAAPEPAAPVAATPVTPAPTEVTPPPAETTTAPIADADPAPAAASGGSTIWLFLAGLGLAAAVIAAFMLLRRRRDDDGVYDDETYEDETYQTVSEPVAPVVMREEPVIAASHADPVAAAPLFMARPTIAETRAAGVDADVAAATDPQSALEPQPALENAEMVTPDTADIDAVLGGVAPHGSRPQLELAMRPTRAGMSRRGAMVQFELTVANAGGVVAEDVRIGAFMLGGNAGQDAAIEKLLIDPPVDSVMPAERIEPGDARRLDASVTMPRDDVDAASDGAHEGFTPILVADARYRMPDGSEGRTAAAFTIGRINGGDALIPIALQDDPAMYADIEARLHSVPAKV